MVEYRDEGCQFYPSCLLCPYPECIEDKLPVLLVANRQAEARDLSSQGMTTAKIAEKLEVSKRQVERYLTKPLTHFS